MVEEKPIEKPYSLNKFRIPKKKSIDSSDTESDKKVNAKSEVVEKSKKAEKAKKKADRKKMSLEQIESRGVSRKLIWCAVLVHLDRTWMSPGARVGMIMLLQSQRSFGSGMAGGRASLG